MNAYGIITQTLHREPDQESLAWAHRFYFQPVTRIRALVMVACLLSIISSFTASPTWISLALLGLGVFGFLGMGVLRASLYKRVIDIVQNDCDPELFCRRYLASIREEKSSVDPMGGIYNFALSLCWKGEWDQAESLMQTMDSNLQKPKNVFCFHHLKAHCAWAKRDREQLTEEIGSLESISPQMLAKGQIASIFQLKEMKRLLDFEISEDFAQGRALVANMFEQAISSPIQRVLLAIHAAYCAADAAEARQWLEYLVKFGGTTWCAAEAKRLLAKTA